MPCDAKLLLLQTRSLPPPPGPTPPWLRKHLGKTVITDLNGLETLILNIKITIEAHQGQAMALQPIEIEVMAPDRLEAAAAVAAVVAMDLIEQGTQVAAVVVVIILISIEMARLLIEEDQMIGDLITMQITIIDRFDHRQDFGQEAAAVAGTNSNKIQILDPDLTQDIDHQVVVVDTSSVLQVGLIIIIIKIFNKISNKIDLYIDLVPPLPAQFLGGRRIKCKKSSRQRSRLSTPVKKCRRG